MTDWIPMFAMPNITMMESIESDSVVLTSISDHRVQAVAEEYPSFATYYRSFKDEFGKAVAPAFIICHKDTPPKYRTAEALASFRDLISISIIPINWARAIRYKRQFGIFFADSFSVYPWMLDRNYELLITSTVAQLGTHDVNRLHGQSKPGLPIFSIDRASIDTPLLQALLTRWHQCYSSANPRSDDIALFRSLNMANAAALMPGGIDLTYYDVGRSLSLWVSALEILVPAAERSYQNIYDLLKRADWQEQEAKTALQAYDGRTRRSDQPYYCWLYGEIYHARNDFLHGNPITNERLILKESGRNLHDYPALLYRMALSAYLPLIFSYEAGNDTKAIGAAIAQHVEYRQFPDIIEAALISAIFNDADYEKHVAASTPWRSSPRKL